MLHFNRIILFSALLLVVFNVTEILSKPAKKKRDLWDDIYDELFGDSEESEESKESKESKDKKFLICSNCSVVVSQGTTVPENTPKQTAVPPPALPVNAPSLLTNSQQTNPSSNKLTIPPLSGNVPVTAANLLTNSGQAQPVLQSIPQFPGQLNPNGLTQTAPQRPTNGLPLITNQPINTNLQQPQGNPLQTPITVPGTTNTGAANNTPQNRPPGPINPPGTQDNSVAPSNTETSPKQTTPAPSPSTPTESTSALPTIPTTPKPANIPTTDAPSTTTTTPKQK